MDLSSSLRNVYRIFPRGRTVGRANVGSMFGCRCKSAGNAFTSTKNQLKVEGDTSYGLLQPKQAPQYSPSLLKPTVFAIFFSSASFAGAAIWQYENMRTRARELIRSPGKWIVDGINPSNLWTRETFGNRIQIRIEKKGSVRQLCNALWNSLSEGQKLFVPIFFANVLVYLAWKVPALRPAMMTYFVSNPMSKKICWPMFLSTFSHTNVLHLMGNMFVLHSFCSVIVPTLGKEQFVAFYFSAGVLSSLVSCVYRILSRDLAVSIGASGAVMGVIGYTSVKFPDNLLSVIFLPFLVFKASTGIKAILAIDFTCLLMKFKVFDHAAHLGGALFGIFWCVWGNEKIWQQRGPLLEWWHQQRNKPSKS